MTSQFRILILASENQIPLDVARCFHKIPGIEIHVLSKESRTPIRFSRHITSFQTHRTETSDAQTLDDIYMAIKKSHADILLPIEVPAIQFVTKNRHILSQFTNVATTPALEQLQLTLDKWIAAKFFAEYNFPQPPTVLCDTDVSPQRIGEMTFPVLLKPARGAGGIGVEVFDYPQQVIDYLRATPPRFGYHIAQTFIEGEDIDCSVLCHNGEIIAYTIQRSLAPAMHERKFAPAATVEFIDHEQTLEIVRRLMRALCWSGVAHIDLRYDKNDGQVKILEINPRYWGSVLGSLFAGVNFPLLHCLKSLNIPFEPPMYKKEQFSFSRKVAIKQISRKYINKHKGDLSFKQTSLYYIMSDPLPETLNLFGRGWRKMKHHKSA